MATSFFLSSGWKITHPSEFRAAYSRIGPRFLDFSGRGGRFLAVLEIVVGLSILITGVPRAVTVLPSLLLLAALSLALVFAADLESGCGCWTKPPDVPPRHVYLTRNLVLALFVLTGFAESTGGSINFAVIALSLIVGGLISFTLMQLPEIRLVWQAGRPPTGR